ncbi:DUF4241 domain-containing protein [Rhizobium sp. BE258]|uniref:DUF4241 domain-containing protein n=1 Tax=Rhizobium sp. BE258 TaxID=2817722 RepID=UPI0028634B19|nr:DUF4241 domain-containing protein [Rhizobium sp. BE258]MDR7145671.1 hypothetical protein [Rhizobium sp. BE258]
MRNRIRQAAFALLGAAAVHLPVPAFAAAWDISKASSNFDLVSLDDAALAERKITVVKMGDVQLTSGHIIAADPLAQPDRPAFIRTVPPGNYPVTLYQAFGRVAAASMRFGEGKPARWEMAAIPGQDPAALKDDEILGYPVDAGLGSYMDADTLKLLEERAETEQAAKPDEDVNYYDVIAPELNANGGRFALHSPVSGKPGNVAIFWSGWGDGFYPVFWGLAEDGHPLVMLTDFYVIENSDGRKEPVAQ